jgi:hypothetical protein
MHTSLIVGTSPEVHTWRCLDCATEWSIATAELFLSVPPNVRRIGGDSA